MTAPIERERSPRRGRRWMYAILAVITILVLAAGIGVEVLIHRVEPILKARVVDTLSTRFRSRVELKEFHVSILKGLLVEGGGLKIFPYNLDTPDPVISVGHFSFRTDWRRLAEKPMRVDRVAVDALQIHLPPKEQRKQMPKLNSEGKPSGVQIMVQELDCTNAQLVLGTNKPGKVPLDFEISRVILHRIGKEMPMSFDATLVNPKPVGDIHSIGKFGPWDSDDVGGTPVVGNYEFSNADLGTLKGISGTLASTGNYKGKLDEIVVDGETRTPDFAITTSGRPLPLNTKFHAIVDGTNGDTYLEPVDAMLASSHIIASGKVVRIPGVKGHHIVLNVVVDRARIDDMLRLAVKTDPPVMRGALRLKTKFDLPPGEKDVAYRLRLKGDFSVTSAQFSNDKVQKKVDELSLRGQGRAKEAKDNIPDADVASNMKGNFVLGGGKLTLSSLNYQVPGANITMDGVYSLDGNLFDFHGRARLDATVSKVVGGWKGALLKPVDPFFKKDGAGTDVPIKVTGTKSEPKFGLDFHHKDENASGKENGKPVDLKDKNKDSAPVGESPEKPR